LKIKIKKVTYNGNAFNNKLVARDLNGNEKWSLLTYISETEIECLSRTFPEIKKIKEINKVRKFSNRFLIIFLNSI